MARFNLWPFVPGLALLLLACSPVVDPPVVGTLPARGEKIVFMSDRDGDWDIYRMDLDGTNQEALTINEAIQDEKPAWSPDGRKIAFSSNRDDPDVQHCLQRDPGCNWEIYIMNGDGSDQTNLTNHLAIDQDPTWSPDGGRIAFVSTRDEGNPDIWIMNADGSNPVLLTPDPAADWEPAWSPDGQQIAFVRRVAPGNTEIFVMDTTGQSLVQLTNNRSDDWGPAWSPDGQRLAFEATGDGNSELYMINADGTGLFRITHNSAYDCCARWSLDGDQLIFHSSRNGHDQIYVMNAQGRQLRLSQTEFADGRPDW